MARNISSQEAYKDLIDGWPVADDATLHLTVAVGNVHYLAWPQL